jgi:hypothetical protein
MVEILFLIPILTLILNLNRRRVVTRIAASCDWLRPPGVRVLGRDVWCRSLHAIRLGDQLRDALGWIHCHLLVISHLAFQGRGFALPRRMHVRALELAGGESQRASVAREHSRN